MPATNELLQEGRYRIGQPSGQNGDETIFEAYDTVRNTNVIVREIPVKLNRVATVSQRESLKLAFATQAKALTEIKHDSLLHVHDFFSEIDRQYLVMDTVEGETLSDLLSKNKKPFAIGQVVAWADDLLDALEYLHSRRPSIVHRHISPSNLKVDSSGKVKLLGVGLGGNSDSEFATGSADNENLRYSPMEQIWPGLDPASQKVITNSYDDRSERILKEPLDARSDIYSLGATLYFLVTGHEPVDPIERSIEILEGKLDPLREPTKVDSKIPPEISDVLMKALEIKRENRYDSALIMRQVLKTAVVRVQEREEEESREQQDAAEIIRNAQAKAEEPSVSAEQLQREAAEAEQKRKAEEAEEKRREAEAAQRAREAEAEEKRRQEAAQKLREAEAEQQRQKEQMARQLREAEQQRILAEQAEAERLLREEEEAAKAAEPPTNVPVENLLEIPVSAEVVAYRDSSTVEEDELAAVLEELEKVEAESVAKRSGFPKSSPVNADAISGNPSVDVPFDTSDDDDIFSTPAEDTGYRLPIPAIAGAVGLVAVLAVGGWFVMSGSDAPKTTDPAPVPLQAVQVAEPAPVEPAPATDTVTTSQPDNAVSSVTTEGQTELTATAKPAAATKPKKVEPPKAEKKKVTVDDLINDN